jgi:hypothetical protein
VLEFDLKNNSTTNALMPLSANGASFFAELRVLLGGIEAERIGGAGGCSYGRIFEALSRGLPSAKRVDEAALAFGIKTADAADVLKLAQGGILNSNSQAQNSTKTYWHKSLFGLAQQHLYAPLWSLTGNGLTFEFL